MNTEELYNDCKGILYKFANQFNVDIGVCEIGFMKAVKNFDETKGVNFKTFLTHWIKGACLTEKRNESRDKRKANQNIVDYNIEWVGVKPRDSKIAEIKAILLPDEWQLLYNRFYLGYNQSETAKMCNCSQINVSRKLQNIYAKVRGKLVV